MPKQIFVVPYRYRIGLNGEEPGWFDYQPLSRRLSSDDLESVHGRR